MSSSVHQSQHHGHGLFRWDSVTKRIYRIKDKLHEFHNSQDFGTIGKGIVLPANSSMALALGPDWRDTYKPTSDWKSYHVVLEEVNTTDSQGNHHADECITLPVSTGNYREDQFTRTIKVLKTNDVFAYMRLGLDPYSTRNLITQETIHEHELSYQISRTKSAVYGLKKVKARLIGEIELSFYFVDGNGRKMHKCVFHVLEGDHPFDILIGRNYITDKQILIVNESALPVRDYQKEEKAAAVEADAADKRARDAAKGKRQTQAAEKRQKDRDTKSNGQQ